MTKMTGMLLMKEKTGHDCAVQTVCTCKLNTLHVNKIT